MITLDSADSALKTVYLGVIGNQLNVGANPLLSKIKQTTNNVYGNEVVKYRDDMPPEYKEKYVAHALVSQGWAKGKTIERKAPNFTEDLCEAFYASKGEIRKRAI